MNLTLIIPKLDNDGADNAAVIETSIRRMCGVYGGVTAYDARGYWLNADGRLFADEVTVLMSEVIAAKGSEADDLRALARDVLAATDQEAIFLSIGGAAEIIE